MKILSIDFDAIMFPCIRLYNEYCYGNENATTIWRQLEFDRDINQYLSYDANVYKNIGKIIFKNIKNGAKLIPIQEHQMLVDHLKKYDLLDLQFDITNIDYHHDIAYNRNSFVEMEFDNYTCADWAGYLMTLNPETTLTWVRCPGSSPYNEDIKEFTNTITIKRIDEIVDLDDDYDLIYFCLSPQWVPYVYHHLYDLLIDLAKEAYPECMDHNIIKPIKVVKEVVTEVPVIVSVPYDNVVSIPVQTEKPQNAPEMEE